MRMDLSHDVSSRHLASGTVIVHASRVVTLVIWNVFRCLTTGRWRTVSTDSQTSTEAGCTNGQTTSKAIRSAGLFCKMGCCPIIGERLCLFQCEIQLWQQKAWAAFGRHVTPLFVGCVSNQPYRGMHCEGNYYLAVCCQVAFRPIVLAFDLELDCLLHICQSVETRV